MKSALFYAHYEADAFYNMAFDEFMFERQINMKKSPKLLVLYMALPFCLKTNPPDCGYCLFPHVEYSNKAELEKYLKYL